MTTPSPRTLYAVAAEFAGPGIGTTAFHAAEGLRRAGMLAGVACLTARPGAADESLLTRFPFLPDGVRRATGDKLYYEAKNRVFDARLTALVKKRAEGLRTLHVWNSQATGAAGVAKAAGLRVVIDRASSHILTQTRILEDAYRRRGLRYRPTSARVIRRCLTDYQTADAVAVPSPFAYQSFLDHGYPQDRLALLPFGAEIRPDTTQADPTRREPLTVLFVGQVGVRKGALDVLAAWDIARLRDARLILAGGEEPAARRLFDPWRGRADILFAGFTDRIPALMAGAQVFVFPSLEEGSALVTYEAMAHGLAMITTAEAGSVAEPGESALMVPAGEPDALAAALRRVHDRPDEAARLGYAARAHILNFPWESYGDRVANLHRRLARGESPETRGRSPR